MEDKSQRLLITDQRLQTELVFGYMWTHLALHVPNSLKNENLFNSLNPSTITYVNKFQFQSHQLKEGRNYLKISAICNFICLSSFSLWKNYLSNFA